MLLVKLKFSIRVRVKGRYSFYECPQGFKTNSWVVCKNKKLQKKEQKGKTVLPSEKKDLCYQFLHINLVGLICTIIIIVNI